MDDPLDNLDFLIGDILASPGGQERDTLETDRMPTPRALRRQAKRRFRRHGQRQALTEIIEAPPEPGESIHVISGSKFDFWTWVPVLVDMIGRAETFYASTWTLNRDTVVELFELCDADKIEPAAVSFVTGIYFKRRETATYATLLAGIRQRGGRYRAFLNHAKVLLLSNEAADAWLVIEGSANLTSNPRWEQYVITNDRALYDFHREWFEDMLGRHKPEPELPRG
jgi:hypothetical protein